MFPALNHNQKQAMKIFENRVKHAYPEGTIASNIERQTAKLPSELFLWAAGASIAASLSLKMMNRDRDALFVGQWAPTFLLLGTYNKLVKLMGPD
jgi:hypothetical protein